MTVALLTVLLQVRVFECCSSLLNIKNDRTRGGCDALALATMMLGKIGHDRMCATTCAPGPVDRMGSIAGWICNRCPNRNRGKGGGSPNDQQPDQAADNNVALLPGQGRTATKTDQEKKDLIPRIFVSGPITETLSKYVEADEHLKKATFIYSANPYNVSTSIKDSAIEAKCANAEKWYNGQAYGASFANSVYGWFYGEHGRTKLGDHAADNGFPLPEIGIATAPISWINDLPELWSSNQEAVLMRLAGEDIFDEHSMILDQNMVRLVSQVLQNVTDFVQAVKRHRTDYGATENTSNLIASLNAVPSPDYGTMIRDWTQEASDMNARYTLSTTGFKLEGDVSSFQDTTPFSPVQACGAAWCGEHTNRMTVMRFFGASTPEQVTLLNKVITALVEQSYADEGKEYNPMNEYRLQEQASKFIPLVIPTGCFTDVANFLHYNVGAHGRKIPKGKGFEQIMVAELENNAVPSFERDFLQPLEQINSLIDDNIFRAPSSGSTLADVQTMIKDLAYKVIKITTIFPHSQCHDTEMDDLLVMAIMHYAQTTLQKLTPEKLTLLFGPALAPIVLPHVENYLATMHSMNADRFLVQVATEATLPEDANVLAQPEQPPQLQKYRKALMGSEDERRLAQGWPSALRRVRGFYSSGGQFCMRTGARLFDDNGSENIKALSKMEIFM